MPVNGPTLTGRLAPFNGVTAYGTSAKGGTRAAYDTVCAQVIGGPLNARRAFNGVPEPADGFTVWSTKEFSRASISDRHAAFAAYGKPAADIFHHEPLPGNPPDPMDYGPDRYDEFNQNVEAMFTNAPQNVARFLCFQRADITDGTMHDCVPEKPDCVDGVLFDAYRDKYPGRSVKELLTPCAERAEEWGCMWGLGEWGVAGPALERIRWAHDLVEFCCEDRNCVMLLNFQSDEGRRAPVNYDGSKEWSIQKSQDRYTPEMAALWRDLAELTRQQAAADGNPTFG